jgi:hypothetical protein
MKINIQITAEVHNELVEMAEKYSTSVELLIDAMIQEQILVVKNMAVVK